MAVFTYMVDNLYEALNLIEEAESSEFYGSRLRRLPPNVFLMASRGALPEELVRSYSRQTSRDRMIVPVTDRITRQLSRDRMIVPVTERITRQPSRDRMVVPVAERITRQPSRDRMIVPVTERVSRQASRDRIVVPVTERVPRPRGSPTPNRLKPPPPPPHPTPMRVSTLSLPGRGVDFLRKESLVSYGYNEENYGDAGVRADESDSGIGLCGWILTAISWGLVIVTLPFSLCVCFKVVQEYERAVIFRLGRLLSGGSRGPGIFFVLPCIENYTKVDLRTSVIDIPPQEVRLRHH
eukprot:snap_masked-scaffold17_size721972-processed-gene-4.0 protein:Tk09971 transcript:snap_masked-scaffold17_size721972-processed-gene-4.0-mRNA-1 annotation:"conserved hypothetical protein"